MDDRVSGPAGFPLRPPVFRADISTMVFILLLLLFLPLVSTPAGAQDFYPGHDIEVLRGEVQIDVEPIYGGFIDREYPLPAESLRRRALEDAAMHYSAMIYGWSFYYDIGEQARGIEEKLELSPLGHIPWGDPRLQATDVELRDQKLCMWTDYRLDESQKRRAALWRAGRTRSIQGRGLGPLGMPVLPTGEDAGESNTWLDYKRQGLEDAARAAIRAMLRGGERNRPKEARGFIALAGFPVYGIDAGRWTAFARFRVDT
ncbi:MAG: hypothetical protein LBU19_03130, partial [Treponema sp.]|nr:hypothetical protein [Treponema sp.]